MKNLFISAEDEITIPFVIAETPDGDMIAEEDAAKLKEFYDGKYVKDTVEEHKMVFRQPSFGDSVQIIGKMTTADGVNVDFNPLGMRFERMAKLIKSWTFTDGTDPVPATAANVKALNPKVANLVGAILDSRLGGV